MHVSKPHRFFVALLARFLIVAPLAKSLKLFRAAPHALNVSGRGHVAHHLDMISEELGHLVFAVEPQARAATLDAMAESFFVRGSLDANSASVRGIRPFEPECRADALDDFRGKPTILWRLFYFLSFRHICPSIGPLY